LNAEKVIAFRHPQQPGPSDLREPLYRNVFANTDSGLIEIELDR
jgi:hypothetical protein